VSGQPIHGSADYAALLADINQRVRHAQTRAMLAVQLENPYCTFVQQPAAQMDSLPRVPQPAALSPYLVVRAWLRRSRAGHLNCARGVLAQLPWHHQTALLTFPNANPIAFDGIGHSAGLEKIE